MPSATPPTEVYYRWTDAGGRVHVVSSLDAVPIAMRARVERLELARRPTPGVIERVSSVATSTSDQSTLVLGLGAAGLVLFVLSRVLPRQLRFLGKLGLFAVVAALLGGLYLGAIRRSTGLASDSLLATPSALIDDTKRAVEKINQRQKQQEEELRNIQNEAK
jgi:hypothetical protein